MFVCNTYYQVIVAIQMRLTIFATDKAYIVMSNDIKNIDRMVEQITKTNIFDGVYFYIVKKRSKIINGFFSVFGKNVCNLPKNLAVDSLYSFNFDLYFHFIFAFLERKNRDIQTFRFEEGILSYFVPFDDSKFLSVVYSLRHIFKKKNARPICFKFYCFRPELYSGGFETARIPPIKVNDDKNFIFLQSFALEKNERDTFSENEIVYLASVYNIDGHGEVNETKLISDIEAKIKPNIIKVKAHPRDNSKSFKNTFEFKNAPIELFPMCSNFSGNCIIMSSFSGSLLNMVSLYGESIKCIYTTMLCDCSNNSLAMQFSNIIKDLCNTPFYKNKLLLVSSIDELIVLLKQFLTPDKGDANKYV